MDAISLNPPTIRPDGIKGLERKDQRNSQYPRQHSQNPSMLSLKFPFTNLDSLPIPLFHRLHILSFTRSCRFWSCCRYLCLCPCQRLSLRHLRLYAPKFVAGGSQGWPITIGTA